MTGLVVVSHSRPLAEAAVALARQMLPGDRPRIEIAAGVRVAGSADPGSADGPGAPVALGTDANAVAAAIERARDERGVLVLMDIGSAILSAETALELLGPSAASTVRLSAAPLVEGLIGAAVAAASGGDLARVAAEAEVATAAKRRQLGITTATDTDAAVTDDAV